MNRTVIISAALAALINMGTGTIALLTDAQSFSEISVVALAIVGIGSLVNFAKDVLSSMREPRA